MNKSHITTRYIAARCVEKLYRLINPKKPWLSPAVNRILTNKVNSTWVGFEYGSGRSTIWFAKRIRSLVSVEHNPKWYALVKDELEKECLSNVDLVLCEREEDKEPEGADSKYVSVINQFSNGSFDFILVDGVYRAECCASALPKLKPDGMLIIDDIHRYLPSESHSPFARKISQGPISKRWLDFLDMTKKWNRVWTSNSVSDTVIYFRTNL